MPLEAISPRDFVEAMTLAVWQAGAAVRWLEGRVENLPKVGEASAAKAALTFGDCVSQEVLLTALRHHFPWVEIEAEEDTPTASSFAGNRSETRVVIDPIDGTLRYLQRDGLYAILLGLERDGRIDAALVGLPQLDIVIRAVRGEGAEIARAGAAFEPLTAQHLQDGGDVLLVSHELPAGLAERLYAEGFQLRKAAGGAIGVAPFLPDTVGAIRTTSDPSGLSHRTWVSTLATLEVGGCVEALQNPLPETFTQGIHGVLVAGTAAEIARLRKLLDDI